MMARTLQSTQALQFSRLDPGKFNANALKPLAIDKETLQLQQLGMEFILPWFREVPYF